MQNHRARKWALRLIVLGVIYYLAAYQALPRLWFHHEHQPGLVRSDFVTVTAQGIPGDPLNVGLVGDKADVVRAMNKAGWFPADPITLKTSVEIVASVAFDRSDNEAPVSPLYYDGRVQDLAFEKPIGTSADRRNHVRFWQVLDKGAEGRPVWLGSASQDAGVGISHDTGQVTHRISPYVDKERDLLTDDLVAAKIVTEVYNYSGVGPTVNGRNGEGDWYETDGEIRFSVLSPGADPITTPTQFLGDNGLITAKNSSWSFAAGLFAPTEAE